jgi:osmoprotectant transport system permease protein
MSFLVDVYHWLTASAQWNGEDGVPHLLVHHLQVSVASLVVAFVLAAPLAAWLAHRRKGGVLAINIANAGRAVPAYALLVLAVQIVGIDNPRFLSWTGSFTAFIALVALGIPPIFTNTYIGMREVSEELVDAARGMGLSEREVVTGVEVPVASPLIFAGIRTAMVGIIATASLASFVGVDTLATPIYIGININDNVSVFGGAILVASLAIIVDALLAFLQRFVISPGLRPRARRRATVIPSPIA